MHTVILSLAAALAIPAAALAQSATPIGCDARPGCQRAFRLDGFHMLSARPVPLPEDRIALVGADDLYQGTSLWLLELSLADAAVAGEVEAAIGADERAAIERQFRAGAAPPAEISPSADTFALFLDAGDGAARGATIRFFGASGKPLGLVAGPFAAPWPAAETFEWSPVDLFARFAGMNALKFEAGRLRLGYAGLSILAEIETGALGIVDTASGERGDLVALLDPAFDPVGFESYWFGDGLAAAARYPSDGQPAELAVLQGGRAYAPQAMPPRPERGDRRIDAEAAGGSSERFFSALTLTPDASRLAVLRHGGDGGAVAVYDTATGALTWSSPLAEALAPGATLVWSGPGELVLVRQGDAGTELYVYAPAPAAP